VNGTAALLSAKRRILAATVRSIGKEPPLKVAVVGLFAAGWVCGAFLISREGFSFVARFPGIGEYLLDRLLYLFSLGVFAMLALSCALLAYPLLFVKK